MKKSLIALAIFAGLFFASCEKNSDEEDVKSRLDGKWAAVKVTMLMDKETMFDFDVSANEGCEYTLLELIDGQKKYNMVVREMSPNSCSVTYGSGTGYYSTESGFLKLNGNLESSKEYTYFVDSQSLTLTHTDAEGFTTVTKYKRK